MGSSGNCCQDRLLKYVTFTKMTEQPKVKYIVRVANNDLNGKKQLYIALQKIKGINVSFAHAICALLNLDKHAITGALDDASVAKIDAFLKEPKGLPVWMLNRQRDYETNKDGHLLASTLKFTVENDVKRMSSTKSYVGLRHVWHLPVRGQRNQANHRPTKSKNAKAAKRGKKTAA
ncbi:MAG: small subunit ribosomal protein S13 [Candidatus Woesearchaeota archaeon]|jgi:small subunit ribosomal protein S13